MKRRSNQPKRRRDRKTGQSPYARNGKREYQYPAGLADKTMPCIPEHETRRHVRAWNDKLRADFPHATDHGEAF